jgi:cytoskeletal protein RodZ
MTFIKILYNYPYMLEKLITELKKSLPESLRKKMGVAEQAISYSQDSDEGNEFNELAPYAKKKLSAGAPLRASASPDVSDDAAKKRTSMIIRVIIILGIAYFVVDEIILKPAPAEKSADELIAAASKKRKKKSIVKPADEQAGSTAISEAGATAPELAPGEIALTTSSEPLTEPTSTVPVGTVTTDTPPIENINVIGKPDLAVEAKNVVPEAAPEVSEPSEPAVTQTRIGENSIDKKLDQLVETVDQNNSVEEIKIPSQETKSAAVIAMEETKKMSNDSLANMTSKIAEDIPEAPAPSYDQVGRGLVYNCKDKYWACLDKPAFLNCNKNMKWNKSKGNPAECVVQDIYNSDEDCAKIQKYNVSSNTTTGFCQN